jgi:cytochrome b
MSPTTNQRAADTVARPRSGQVKVWDPLVRVFHWSLVLFYALAFATGDDAAKLHEFAGYVVLGLVGFRLVWGMVGSRHARFADFVVGPRAVLADLLEAARFKPKRHLGHNPVGGAMIVVMLVALIATCVTGIIVSDRIPTGGTLKNVHEFLANFTLALAVLHLAGVAGASWLHRENLVRAMITGRKHA